MYNLEFDYCIGEFMVYCRSRQLREKTIDKRTNKKMMEEL